MKRQSLHRTALLHLSALSIVCMLIACTVPAQPPTSSTQTTASSEQFSITPPSENAPNGPSANTSITNSVPSTLSATITLTESATLPPRGSKGDKFLLPNIDTAINRQLTEWLVTTGASIAALTPEVRASSPAITVTLILEDEVAAETVKSALSELNALLLAEAGTLMSIQLPIGYLDQLSQLAGVLLIQSPTSAAPTSRAPFTLPIAEVDALSDGYLFTQEDGFQAGIPFVSEGVDTLANAQAIDWTTLESIQTTKLNHLPLADSAMNAAYQTWHTNLIAAGNDSPQAAWSSELITITLVMQDDASAAAAAAALPTLNIQVLDSYAGWLVVSSPVGQLQALMELSGLLLAQQPTIRPPLESAAVASHRQNGQEPTDEAEVSVVTEGVARSKISVWHSAGFRGQNVRVAIVDSFDQVIINDAFAKKEIPTKVLNGPSEEGADHGIAVAEIVYDMAPQAIISLHSIGSAPDFCIAFANTLENLAKQGNQIISSSISPAFCPSPGNGATNPISQAATRVLNNYNTFYVQAAGNNALHHYERAFREVEVGDLVVNNFATSGEFTINVLVVSTPSGPAAASISAGTILQFFLRWDGGWPRSSQDYDMYLVYYNGSNWVFLDCLIAPCKSENPQDGSQMPFEAITTLAPFTGAYGIVITKFDADGNHFLDLLTGHAQPFLNFNSPSRSLIPAATSQDVFSIAAVDVSSLALESYSSRGPTYGPGNTQNGGFAQPRLAAYANVNTYVSPGFNGTSSATPHVAGAAAVLKSAATCLTARQLGDWLTKNSLDKGSVGYDFSYGSGVLNFPAPSSRPHCYPNHVFVPNIQK